MALKCRSDSQRYLSSIKECAECGSHAPVHNTHGVKAAEWTTFFALVEFYLFSRGEDIKYTRTTCSVLSSTFFLLHAMLSVAIQRVNTSHNAESRIDVCTQETRRVVRAFNRGIYLYLSISISRSLSRYTGRPMLFCVEGISSIRKSRSSRQAEVESVVLREKDHFHVLQ